MHILQTTLIIQQQAALKNMQIPKLKKLKEREEPMSESPPTSSIAINTVWVEKYCVRYLINEPPNKYPKARTKKMYEKYVSSLPVAYEK